MGETWDITRRDFMAVSLAGTIAAVTTGVSAHAAKSIPRWRGFNLHYFFGPWNNGQPVAEDFTLIRELGFDFARIPMWYTLWTDKQDWRKLDEAVLANVDRTVELGREYGVHINLCLHRAPGYCVAKDPAEPFDLFKDTEALEAFCHQWRMFAERYKGAAEEALSFNLVNEPMAAPADYERVVLAAVQAIREVSPERLIFADGLFMARQPVPGLENLGLVQSVHCYDPHELTHYKAGWVEGADQYPLPEWPVVRDGKVFNGKRNLERGFRKWGELIARGAPVHCGEIGCFNHTPHEAALAWFTDTLDILKQHQVGWALWELKGAFGILNSERVDVEYEDWKGQKMDRKLLELLRQG